MRRILKRRSARRSIENPSNISPIRNSFFRCRTRQEHCLKFCCLFSDSFKAISDRPILIGLFRARIDCVCRTIRAISDDQTLLVASSDFVHYGSDFGYLPPWGRTCVPAYGNRRRAVKHISALDAEGLLEYRRTSGVTICGIVPIAVVLDL